VHRPPPRPRQPPASRPPPCAQGREEWRAGCHLQRRARGRGCHCKEWARGRKGTVAPGACGRMVLSQEGRAALELLKGTVTTCTVLCCTVLYCTELYFTAQYCTVLYCKAEGPGVPGQLRGLAVEGLGQGGGAALQLLKGTVTTCTVLHCTILYCTVLYCTVLYCKAEGPGVPWAAPGACGRRASSQRRCCAVRCSKALRAFSYEPASPRAPPPWWPGGARSVSGRGAGGGTRGPGGGRRWLPHQGRPPPAPAGAARQLSPPGRRTPGRGQQKEQLFPGRRDKAH